MPSTSLQDKRTTKGLASATAGILTFSIFFGVLLCFALGHAATQFTGLESTFYWFLTVVEGILVGVVAISQLVLLVLSKLLDRD